MIPMEASVSADLMWLGEPATGVRQAPLASAPTDANLVTATYKDLSMPSVTRSLANATVSPASMLGSVTAVSLDIGAFPAASPASVTVTPKTVTR